MSPPIGRTLFIRTDANAKTNDNTSSVTSPITGLITEIEITTPSTTAVNDLQYAIFRNSEQLYPSGAQVVYAVRPTQGSDRVFVVTNIVEGDVITLLVTNTSSTNYSVVAKVVVEIRCDSDKTDGNETLGMHKDANARRSFIDGV